MRNEEKGFVKGVLLTVSAILLIIVITTTCAVAVQAKTPRHGKVTDKAGNTYIYKHGKLQTGWFKYKGNIYYAHKTKSACYPKGSICKRTYRVRGKRMYYFDENGKRLKKDSRYIELNKASKSVHRIFAPGISGKRWCYNANHQRYQELDKNGRWVDVGNQCWPYGMVDWQE